MSDAQDDDGKGRGASEIACDLRGITWAVLGVIPAKWRSHLRVLVVLACAYSLHGFWWQ